MTTSLVTEGWIVTRHNGMTYSKKVSMYLGNKTYDAFMLEVSQDESMLFPVGTKVKIILEKE
jgi:hypothetical protein